MTALVVHVVDPAHPAGAALDEAARRIREGGLVAFPTETVYGLGANALDPDAVARIYAAKGRPSTNPLICHVLDAADARHQLAAVWPPAATALAEAFWPGPLTLVLPARAHVPSIITAGTATVAVRVPSHPVARALLAAAERPIAAPSANRSMAISPTTAAHVVASLGEAAEFVLDGGGTTVGIESAVVDLTGPEPVLLRPGSIGLEALEAVIGPVRLADAVDDPDRAARSPGRAVRHYAPATPLRIVSQLDLSGPGPIGVIRQAGLAEVLPADVLLRELPADPAGYARHLYAVLHELDCAGCREIQLLRPPETPAWMAIHDRIGRAAAPA